MPWKLSSIGFVAALSLLAGCSTTSEQPSQATSQAAEAPAAAGTVTSGRCDSDAGQFAVGQQPSAALLAQARSKTGSQDARFIGPNDMVTLEYRSERVNLNVDATGKVARVNCG